MKNKKTFYNQNILKKKELILVLSLLFILLTLGVFLIVQSFKESSNETNILLSYNITQKNNYDVTLFDNSHITETIMGENENYIADLVKTINLNLGYHYSGSKIIPIKCKYNIMALIIGDYIISGEVEKNKVWQKEYEIVKEKEAIYDETSVINIDQEIEIDFNFYNKEVEKFRNELRLPIDAKLELIMDIELTSLEDQYALSVNQENKLIIPLNKAAFKITKDFNPEIINTIEHNKEDIKRINFGFIISGIVLLILFFVILIKYHKRMFVFPSKDSYEVKLKRILRDYGDVIIEVVNPIKEKGLNVIEVINYNEMMDLVEELRIPMMFYETKTGKEGEFTLNHNDILYKYKLKEGPEK